MPDIRDMPNPAAAADAEQHMRAELETMGRKFRAAGLLALAGAGVLVGAASAWKARRAKGRPQ
jgi:hypothetical protein